jgi:hypothetical protein
MARINLRNTVVTFMDADGGNTLTFGPGPGDLSVTNLVAADNEEPLEATNRSAHDGFAEGNKLRQEWSLTLEPDGVWTAAAQANILDWIRRTGQYDPTTGSVALSSVDPCKWAWQIKTETVACGVTGGFTLPKCRGMGSFSEADTASTLACSGTNYVAPTFQ